MLDMRMQILTCTCDAYVYVRAYAWPSLEPMSYSYNRALQTLSSSLEYPWHYRSTFLSSSTCPFHCRTFSSCSFFWPEEKLDKCQNRSKQVQWWQRDSKQFSFFSLLPLFCSASIFLLSLITKMDLHWTWIVFSRQEDLCCSTTASRRQRMKLETPQKQETFHPSITSNTSRTCLPTSFSVFLPRLAPPVWITFFGQTSIQQTIRPGSMRQRRCFGTREWRSWLNAEVQTGWWWSDILSIASSLPSNSFFDFWSTWSPSTNSLIKLL